MPRFFLLRGRVACPALALIAALRCALETPAQPANPLRPAGSSGALRIVPVPSDPPAVRPMAAWEDVPAREGAAVGPQALADSDFGQPEPLPMPQGANPNLADQLGQPDLFGGAGSFHDGEP